MVQSGPTPQTSTPQGASSRSARLRLWILVGWHAALSIALLDAILALASDPTGVASAGRIVPPLALLAALAAVALVACVFAAEAAGRLEKATATDAAAIAAAAIVGFGLLVLADLNRVSLLRTEPIRFLLGGVLIAATALLVHTGARRVASRMGWDDARWLRGAAMVPLILLAVLAVQILGSSTLGPATRGVTGAGLLAVALAAAASLWLVLRVRPAAVALGMLLGLAGVVAVSAYPAADDPGARIEGATRPPAGLRHIILISIDTLRQDALSVYDDRAPATPGIAGLADESLLFTRAYSAAPWTIPSFVSLMTGLPALAHRVNSDFAEIPLHLGTLAEQLKGLGYRTAAIGHHPQLLKLGRGFDRFDFTPYLLPYHPRMTGTKLLWRNADQTNGTDELPGAIARWLDGHQHEPFFLWAHFLDPHSPYNPPARLVPDHPLVAEFGSQSDGVRMPGIRSGRQVRSPREREWLRQLYAAEVSWVDESVGRILDDLRARGIFDESLIVLLSDHGEEFWEHQSFGHGHSLYEELVRVPLIVKLPGGVATGRVEAPVSTAALGPTLLQLAGAPELAQSGSLPGFAGLLRAEPAATAAADVMLGGVEYFEERGGVVSGDWKLIRGRHSGREELYSLADDPAETRSRATDRPDDAARLRAVLVPQLSQLGDADAEEEALLTPEVSEALKALGYVE